MSTRWNVTTCVVAVLLLIGLLCVSRSFDNRNLVEVPPTAQTTESTSEDATQASDTEPSVESNETPESETEEKSEETEGINHTEQATTVPPVQDPTDNKTQPTEDQSSNNTGGEQVDTTPTNPPTTPPTETPTEPAPEPTTEPPVEDSDEIQNGIGWG